ncbi:MAG: ABC transporter substrate-binding protein [Oscillospiraceae bacterium]|nr:ABC transporter substrate-binding protein [Oscillospiraceae bacterium]
MKTHKWMALALSAAMLAVALASCHDSSAQPQNSNQPQGGQQGADQSQTLGKVDYDPQEAIAPYLEYLPEIPEADKDYVIEMGYNNCDHMVGAIIGQDTGLYDALGLHVNITKTGQVASAMASGEMVVGYAGFGGLIQNYNKGARVIMPAGSHLGGAMYLVVSPEIQSLDEVVGKTLDMGEGSNYSTFWLEICDKLGIPSDITNYYEGSSMGDEDAMMALRAGHLDIFTCCDPYASIAEEEGFGKILATAWHADVKEDKSTGWGIHCGYYINEDFAEQHPELTTRLVLAHCLSLKYMYQHPYSAGLMFAKTFGTSDAVGLRTMYLKTNAEGRTMCWTISQENMDNYAKWYDMLGVPEEERTLVTDVDGFLDLSWLDKCGIEDFQTFLKEENIDEIQPLGMSYADWLYMAETIDGVDHNSGVGKVDKWMENGSKTESPIEPYTGDGVYIAPMHTTD